jgi:hypothetical protein
MPDVEMTEIEVDGKRCYRARLSKDGLAVLCGYPTCARLGTVRQPRKQPWYRELILSAGWYRDQDGVWRLSQHAKKRVKQGKRPQDRRPGALEATEDQSEVAFYPGGFVRDQDLIVCPNCNRCNLIDFVTLRLTTDAEKRAGKGRQAPSAASV